MDASTLRIILLVLGTLLLVAMYLWEQRRSRERSHEHSRRTRRRPAAARREPRFDARYDSDAAPSDGPVGGPTATTTRREGQGSHADDAGAGFSTGSASIDSDHASRRAGRRTNSGSGKPAPGGSRPSEAAAPQAGSDGSDDEPLLVQLFVVAVEGAFDGPSLHSAAEQQHLTAGEMAIYHRLTGDGSGSHARFSMANLVEPGTFPFDAMDGFSTPGLALFAQFEGRPSDLMVYDELVQTSRAIADELGGEVRLPGRIRFDDNAREFVRSELLELINERADSLNESGDRAGVKPTAAARNERSAEQDASAFEDSSSSQRP